MVSLTCSTTALDDVTLVSAVVDGDAAPRRVRLANRLDGPVWPPRRQGVPEDGWDDEGFTGRVPADRRLAVDYASPALPEGEPVEIESVSPAEESKPETEAPAVDSAAGVVRELGVAAPPRDAVPIAVADAGDSESPSAPTPDGPSPESVEAWLDAVEDRVATAERLTEADTLPEATAALTEAGGLAAAEDLSETVASDAEALAAVARRAEALAERAKSTDVPVATFERLA